MAVLRGVIGRGMARSAGQVAVSVVATLIATQIYGSLHRIDSSGTPRAPSMTSGGKFDARIAGAELPKLPEAARPAISLVNWAIVPLAPTGPMEDIVWTGVDEGPAAPVQLPARVPRREAKEARKAGTAIPVILPPSRPAVVAAADTPDTLPASTPTPAAAAAASSGGVWSFATGMAAATARSIGAFGGSVLSFGGSAVALSGSALGHLVPDRR